MSEYELVPFVWSERLPSPLPKFFLKATVKPPLVFQKVDPEPKPLTPVQRALLAPQHQRAGLVGLNDGR